MVLKRQKADQRAVMSKSAFFSPDEFFMSCAIYVSLHISFVRKPVKVAEKGPKMQQLPHPRPIDFTPNNQDHKVKISPLPLSQDQSWLLELLDVSLDLQTMAQPHLKQSQAPSLVLSCQCYLLLPQGCLTPSMINFCFNFFITQPEHDTFFWKKTIWWA